LPKELEEHKTNNNKDGIEYDLHAVRRPCTRSTYESAGERKIQSTISTSCRTILRRKAYYLSASQARPMLTTVVV